MVQGLSVQLLVSPCTTMSVNTMGSKDVNINELL